MSRMKWNLLTGMVLAVGCAILGAAEARGEKTVLRLRLDGPMLEAPNDAAGLLALFEQQKVDTLHDWVRTIRQAGKDQDIDGLVLIVEAPQVGFAQVEEMTQALRAFRSDGKPVYCYMDYAGNLSYALAAAADHVTLAENSELSIIGLQAEMVFFKGLLSKIGIEAEMLRCGAYKSAVEPFTRTEPSPEAAENMNWLLDSLYERWIGLIAEGRHLEVDEVKRLVDAAPLSAAEAKEADLVDDVSSFADFTKMIRKQFGKDAKIVKQYKEEAGPEIDMSNPFAVFEIISRLMQGASEPTEPGVGLIYIDGGIVVGKSEESALMGSVAGSTSVRAAFQEAREDDNIRAVVVRVDSPGGSALASDIIWKAMTRCAAEKPLVVSMGGVAGSGGYYVAVPGDVVFADATTITGSIGVLGGKLVWKELMEDTLGITTTAFSRGKHAGLMTMSRKWTEDERAWLRQYIDTVYEQFKGRVMESRGDRIKGDLEKLAGGRVYTGEQALKIGLVDKIGGLTDALDSAADRVGLGDDYEVYIVPKPSEFAAFMDFLQALSGEDNGDEFEMGVSARLQSDPLLRAALPLIKELLPTQAQELLRGLRDLTVLQRERVGCFMPFVPRVH